jgi:hypothetical protein
LDCPLLIVFYYSAKDFFLSASYIPCGLEENGYRDNFSS